MEAGRILSINIRSLRKKSELSQQALSKLSGVPRSTIASIEAEGGNPSLSNLVRLANALRVNVDELLTKPRGECHLQRLDDIPKVNKSGGRALVHKLLPDPISGMEFDRVNLKANSRMKGVPHTLGTREYLVVLKGKITVYVLEEAFEVKKGEVFSFPGDQPHSYYNATERDCEFMSVVVLAPRYPARESNI